MNDMALFALLVEAGSFTAAAGRAGLPKSTVSRRRARLEERLGVRLIERSTRRLRVTEAGRSTARIVSASWRRPTVRSRRCRISSMHRAARCA